jgi:uncharacterized protein YggE
MLRYTHACALLLVLLYGPHAYGQVLAMPAPESTLTVATTGSADADADWAEVALSLEGHGATAAEALLSNQDSVQKTTAQLERLGLKKESLRLSLPQIISSAMQMQIGMPEDPKAQENRFSVTTALAVRLDHFVPARLFESICAILDAVMSPGKSGVRMPTMQDIMSSKDMVTFGVNDPKPLRDKAIADAMSRADELAAAVAARAGKKLGPLAGIAAQGPEGQGPGMGGIMAMVNMLTSQGKPGRATYSVSITATYRLQ